MVLVDTHRVITQIGSRKRWDEDKEINMGECDTLPVFITWRKYGTITENRNSY